MAAIDFGKVLTIVNAYRKLNPEEQRIVRLAVRSRVGRRKSRKTKK